MAADALPRRPAADQYNGQQGDIWDAQKDMACAGRGRDRRGDLAASSERRLSRAPRDGLASPDGDESRLDSIGVVCPKCRHGIAIPMGLLRLAGRVTSMTAATIVLIEVSEHELCNASAPAAPGACRRHPRTVPSAATRFPEASGPGSRSAPPG